MTVEKKAIRGEISSNHVGGSLGYVGSPVSDYRRMVISREIALKGQISSCDYLVIEGELEASSFSARRLDIFETGAFSGVADVHDCVIAGRFDGKLTVRGRLTIKATGFVSGTVEYETVEVEAGGKIYAQLAPLQQQAVEETPSGSTLEKVEPFNDNDEAQQQITERGTSVFRRAAGN